jgi:predicted RND superfamily exporter protein
MRDIQQRLQDIADRAWKRYEAFVVRRPRTSLAVLAAVFVFFCCYIKDFRLDASGDSLVLEHDDDVRYYRAMSGRYESGDFVIITYTPPEDLFSDASLDRLRRVRERLSALPRVSSVITLLDVPLLKNPPGPLKDLQKNIKTLESPEADRRQAAEEFRTSEIYRNLLVSKDLRSTALQVNFEVEKSDSELVARRSVLREREYRETLTRSEREELKGLEVGYRRYKDEVKARRHEDIAAIRSIIREFSPEARFYLGGVPMIVDDIMTFIRSDVKTFGVLIIVFIMLTLYGIYRRMRWVLLPTAACIMSVLFMVGGMGWSHWDVTVVSSNFVSLQLTLTMSLAIHIVSRYRELLRGSPRDEESVLVYKAARQVFVPALFTNLTTMAGFDALIFCDILPVVQFGWMMTLGLVVSLVVVFWLMPSCMALMSKTPVDREEKESGSFVTDFYAHVADKYGTLVYVLSALVAVATGIGVFRLQVENSFINYFKKSSEIHRGMKFIDDELGGTTPLDVIIRFDKEPEKAKPAAQAKADDVFDSFGEFEEEKDPSKYWFTRNKIDLIERVHDYLDALPETGKVMSLATLRKTSSDLNEGKPFDDFSLAILYNTVSEKFKKLLVDPYVSVEENETRITTRVLDSRPDVRRDVLIRRIRADLAEKFGLAGDRVRVSGIMVLYNNMLQSLYSSQIKTIGTSVVTLVVMFFVLFQSWKIALLTLAPQLLSAVAMLGVMGLGGIPLDVMTITIVSISVGIAVEDSIHYVYRFRTEIEKDRDYIATMRRCHASIGNAMLYTSVAVTVGFSILALSNFVPTILFGLLTGLAMAAAATSAQTLLPRLIILFKPFGPEGRSDA